MIAKAHGQGPGASLPDGAGSCSSTWSGCSRGASRRDGSERPMRRLAGRSAARWVCRRSRRSRWPAVAALAAAAGSPRASRACGRSSRPRSCTLERSADPRQLGDRRRAALLLGRRGGRIGALPGAASTGESPSRSRSRSRSRRREIFAYRPARVAPRSCAAHGDRRCRCAALSRRAALARAGPVGHATTTRQSRGRPSRPSRRTGERLVLVRGSESMCSPSRRPMARGAAARSRCPLRLVWPRWAPDGRRIRFATPGPPRLEASSGSGRPSIARASAAGPVARASWARGPGRPLLRVRARSTVSTD